MEISIKQIRSLAAEVMSQRGLSKNEIEMILDHLTEAELTGRPSHGFVRIARLCKKLDESPVKEITVVKETPISALLDGGNRPGIVVATKATEIAVKKAKKNHVGLVGGYNTDAIAVAGFYARKAALQGLISLVTCNSVAGVAPWGSIDCIMGTNPLAIAIPTDREPIVLDFATSKTTYGSVVVAAKKGEQIPLGLVIDKNGNPTTNPNDLPNGGALLPIADHKGSGLGLMLEILAGPMVNAKGGKNAVPGSWGFFMMVFDPKIFVPSQVLNERLNKMIDEIKASRCAPGFNEILLPGEKSSRLRKQNQTKDMLDIPDQIVKDIQALRKG